MLELLVGLSVVGSGVLGYAISKVVNSSKRVRERQEIEAASGHLQGYMPLPGGAQYEDGSFEAKIDTYDSRVTNVVVRNVPFQSIEEALAGGYMEPETRDWLVRMNEQLESIRNFKIEKSDEVASTQAIEASVEKHEERQNIEVINGGVTHGKIVVYRPCFVRIKGSKQFGVQIVHDEETGIVGIGKVFYHPEDVAHKQRMEYDLTNPVHAESFQATFMEINAKKFQFEMNEIRVIVEEMGKFNQLIHDGMLDASDINDIKLLPPTVEVLRARQAAAKKEEKQKEEAVEVEATFEEEETEVPVEEKEEEKQEPGIQFEEAETIQS